MIQYEYRSLDEYGWTDGWTSWDETDEVESDAKENAVDFCRSHGDRLFRRSVGEWEEVEL